VNKCLDDPDNIATPCRATGCDSLVYSSVMQPPEALAKVRAVALALPGVTERPSHGMPAWFVGKKQFLHFTNDHHGDGRLALWCAAPDGVQAMLVEADPDGYFVPPYVGPSGWVGVRLDKQVAWPQIESVIESAHSTRGGARQDTTMKHTFTATLANGAIEVPLDVKAIFGEARPPVKMTFLGETHRNRIAVYSGKYILGIWKAVLEQHDLTDGKAIEVVIERDDKPRTVEPPAELATALNKNANAKAGWDAMSFTHQREWAEAIADAKQPDTRARRVTKAVEAMVAKGAAKAAKPKPKSKSKSSKPKSKSKSARPTPKSKSTRA